MLAILIAYLVIAFICMWSLVNYAGIPLWIAGLVGLAWPVLCIGLLAEWGRDGS